MGHLLKLAFSLLIQLVSRCTGGYCTKYWEYNLRDRTKQRLKVYHALFSFIFAFGITNNYLTNFAYFSERFKNNVGWILATAFALIVVFIFIIGSTITLATGKRRMKASGRNTV